MAQKPVSKGAYRSRIRRKRERIEKLESEIAGLRGDPKNEKQTATGPLDIDAGIDWINSQLTVPTGRLAGQPFVLADWQEAWVRAAMSDGIREGALSVARKNGKSGLISALCLCCLVGPWNRQNFKIVVASIKGDVAKELRIATEQLAEASGFAVKVVKSPVPGGIEGQRGCEMKIVNAEKHTGQALGADFAIIDECGLLSENQRTIYNGMYSSVSTRDGRLLAISIQGDGPMFKELEARAALDSVYFKRYSAPEDCDLDDETAWHAANPGLKDGIKSISYMRDACDKALATPVDQPHFKAFDLNQEIDPSADMVVQLADWRKCEDESAVLENERVVIGIDLGGSASMSAVAAIGLSSGVLKAWGAFGDNPPLSVRGQQDGVGYRYIDMEKRGELRTFPGRVTPVAAFASDVFTELLQDGCQIVEVVGDRYRQEEFQDFLEQIGMPVNFTLRAMGSGKDGSFDVRAFQRLVHKQTIKTAPSLLMRLAISQATLRLDTNGNPSVDRSRANARIDALSASVLAAGMYEREKATTNRVKVWATWD